MLFLVLVCLLSGFLFAAQTENRIPKNIILMIVDGMGPEQITAARILRGNQAFSFENFPVKTTMTTHNATGEVTDSAAAATAMATGVKVDNKVISIRLPGDGIPLKTILEELQTHQKSVGLITNTLLNDATPAAFAAHTNHRSNGESILNDYFQKALPNIVFGADEPSFKEAVLKAPIPYLLVHHRNGLKNIERAIQSGQLRCKQDDCPHIYGGFGKHPLIVDQMPQLTGLPLEYQNKTYYSKKGIPHLSQMTHMALKLFEQNPAGFFLMVESGMVDIIGHFNASFQKNPSIDAVKAQAAELEELEKTVQLILKWMKSHPDTLLIVTADHETGGLQVHTDRTACIGKPKCLPVVSWTAPYYDDGQAKHTGIPVPLYAIGKNAERLQNSLDNTLIVSSVLENNIN